MSSTAAPPQSRRRPPTALLVALGVGALVAALVLVLARSEPSSTRLAESPLLGQEAPALAGPSILDGDEYDLVADDAGRFVLVNFFATWCEPCKVEHPELVRFAADHEVAGDVRVVSVVFSDEADDVQAWFEERGGDWPVVDDPDGRIALDYGVSGVPESYLVGPEGSVRAKIVGGVQAARLEDLVLRARGESG